ncbi:MAG: CaiB/BaiF CoA transferase family protein [Acidimicrobiales bacterium]
MTELGELPGSRWNNRRVAQICGGPTVRGEDGASEPALNPGANDVQHKNCPRGATESMTDSPELLAGIKVVEFAQNAAIPQCGRILAAMGADVVKVEPPTGDAMRKANEFGQQESKAYVGINPGKRSFALDLGAAGARPVIDKFFAWADVALVAFKQSDLARYGIDWDHAKTVNPQLVHLTHTPFGPEGPDADQGGYDVLVQALSGMGFTMNRSSDGVPLPTRPAVNDFGTGIAAALGVVAALRHRDLTGEGQRVDASLLATALSLSTPMVTRFDAPGAYGQPTEIERALLDRRDAGEDFEELRHRYETEVLQGQRNFMLYFRHYATEDGLITVAGLSLGLIDKFHAATGITRPAADASISSNEFQTVVTEAEELFATRTTDEWMEILRGAGYPCGRYNLPFESLNDPQVRANWFVADIDHPVAGRYTTPDLPVQFSATPAGIKGPSPLFAAHTTDVLAELGFDREQTTTMLADGVVVQGQGQGQGQGNPQNHGHRQNPDTRANKA